MTDQGTLLGPIIPPRPKRRRAPPRQTTVTVDREAIAAAVAGGIDQARIITGARMIAEAVRAARPDVRNVVVDLGTIRWTDPKSRHRVTFDSALS
jgi:hypothetical protein